MNPAKCDSYSSSSLRLGLRVFVLVAGSCCIALAATPSLGAPAIHWLNAAGDGTHAVVADLSADGRVAVGHVVGPSEDRAFAWSRADGLMGIESLDRIALEENSPSRAYGVSGDGGIIVGEIGGQAFRSDRDSNASLLDLLPNATAGSAAYGISDNGLWIVGTAHNGGVQTDFDTGLPTTEPRRVPTAWLPSDHGLAVLPFHGQATAVSENGIAVASLQDPMPSGDVQGIRKGILEGYFSFLPGFGTADDVVLAQTATGISADGNTIVGSTLLPGALTPTRVGYRWRGEITRHILPPEGLLPIYAPGDPSAPSHHVDVLDVSSDGLTIGGALTSIETGERSAFLWTESAGLQDLAILLTTLGLDLEGWTPTEIVSLSGDGQALAVHAQRSDGLTSETTSFIAVIPEPTTSLLLTLGLALLATQPRPRRNT